jgi:hypothetical protein
MAGNRHPQLGHAVGLSADPDGTGVAHTGGDGAESQAVLGDVCGKGLDAAVLTGKVRTTLHALRHTGDARFVTLVPAAVTRQESQVRMRVTAAGHLPPPVLRADGRVEQVDTSGTLVGVLPQIGEDRLAECAGVPADAVAERVHMLATEWLGEGHIGHAGPEVGRPAPQHRIEPVQQVCQRVVHVLQARRLHFVMIARSAFFDG